MDTYYRKKSNGRYEPIGVFSTPELYEGIWLVQCKGHSKSYKNLAWRLGEIKPFGDVVDEAALIAIEDELTTWLMKVQDESSTENKEFIDHTLAKKSPKIYDVSASEMARGIINFLSKKLLK